MKKTSCALSLLFAAACMTTFFAGCPRQEAMLEIYVANIHFGTTINTVKLNNLETGMQDNVLDEPLTFNRFDLIRVPLAPYATDSGWVDVDSTVEDYAISGVKIDGTPLLVYMTYNDGGVIRGVDSLQKFLGAGVGAVTLTRFPIRERLAGAGGRPSMTGIGPQVAEHNDCCVTLFCAWRRHDGDRPGRRTPVRVTPSSEMPHG